MAFDTSIPEVTRLARGLGWLAAVGASVGLALGLLLFFAEVPTYVLANTIEARHRSALLLLMVSGGFLLGLVGLRSAWRSYARLDQLALRLAPWVVVGALPSLVHLAAWPGEWQLTLLMGILVVSVVLQRLCERAQHVEPLWRWGWLSSLKTAIVDSRWLPASLVAVGVVSFATYFSLFSIFNHQALRTSAYDLGIEESVMWNAAHLSTPLFRTTPLGGPMTHLGYHQTWITYLIAPLYRVFERPEFLLILQAVMTALAAVPLFLLARRKLGRWWAAGFALAYLLYGPLQGSIMYDFHYQPLGNVLLLSALYCLIERKPVGTVVFVLLTLLLREDMSVPLGVFAMALVLTGERPRAGLVVGFICAVHFGVLKMTIMPTFLGGHPSYINQYQGLLPAGENSYGGVLKTVGANFGFTLHSLLEQPKLVYALELLAPFVLLPLRRPIGWLLVLPGWFFTLLATGYPALNMTSFQYTTYWTIFLFVGSLWALESMAPRRRRAWVPALAVAGVLCAMHFGAVLKNQQVRGAYDVHHFGLNDIEATRYQQVKSLVSKLPIEESVVSSERLVPHVSNRRDSFTLRQGLQNANWLFTGNAQWDAERPLIDQALRGEYGIVYREGEFILAKKGHDTALNAAYRQEMGFPP